MGALIKSAMGTKVKLIVDNDTNIPMLYGAYYNNTKSGQWDRQGGVVALPQKKVVQVPDGPTVTAWRSQYFVIRADAKALLPQLDSRTVYANGARIDIASNWAKRYSIKRNATITGGPIESSLYTESTAARLASTVAQGAVSLII